MQSYLFFVKPPKKIMTKREVDELIPCDFAFLCFLFVFVLTFRVHREPTFLHAFTLLKYFEDTPEARATDNAEYRTEDFVVCE